MKILRTIKLWLREGTSDKVFEVDLVDTQAPGREARFLVNIRHGRRGQTLHEGTKTSYPVGEGAAEKIFNSVVVAKVNEGYRHLDGTDPFPPVESAPASESAPVPVPAFTAPAASREQVLLARLQACRAGRWQEKLRDRLFWRIGELRIREAGPLLIQIAHEAGLGAASYSLVWALVRCAGGSALETLHAIYSETGSHLVRDIAAFALFSPAMDGRQLRVESTLPDAILQTIASPEDGAALAPANPDLALPEAQRINAPARHDAVDALFGALTGLAGREPYRASPTLVELYCLAQANTALHAQLAAIVSRLPVRPPYVPGLRRLFKYAEMIDDAVIFGAVAQRFETAKPMYRLAFQPKGGKVPTAWVAELHGSGSSGPVQLTHLTGAADARTAMSENTLHYLKRRIWRAMRKRGETGQTSYLDFATAYLLAFSKADTVEPFTQRRYRWDYQTRQSYENKKVFNSLPGAWSAGQIIYRHGEHVLLNAGTLTYRFSTDDEKLINTGEAFPELWKAHPDYALRLVLEARCELVAAFGLRLLRERVSYVQALPGETLEALLASPFETVAQFGYSHAQMKLARGEADSGLLAALLASELPLARELAVRRIENGAAAPWAALRLAFVAVTSPHPDVQAAAVKWAAAQKLPRQTGEALAPHLAAWLLTGPAEGRIHHLRICLPLLWPSHDLPLAPDAIVPLMEHSAPSVRAAGVAMLAVSAVDAGALPDALWQALLTSDAPEILAAGLKLLGRLSDEQLAERAFLVTALATAPSAEVRQSARPLIARLAASFPRLADDLAKRVIDSLFRTAPDDAFAEDAVALMREALSVQFAMLDANLIWRLLHAKAKGAQRLGAEAVITRDPAIYSVRQIARLGNHAYASVRQWAMAAYDAAPARFRAEAADAVLLIESEWDDARAFAWKHFDGWPDAMWTPDVLAIIADSTRPEILSFARSVLRRLMKPGEASVPFVRLLEHPATSMHLLVTEVLTADAARDEAVFAKLLPLARIMLLQVHKGRAAKDRIGEFLHAEALKSRERAAAIAPVFTDLSLSILERDRTRAVSALRDIDAAFPGVIAASPLKTMAPAIRIA